MSWRNTNWQKFGECLAYLFLGIIAIQVVRSVFKGYVQGIVYEVVKQEVEHRLSMSPKLKESKP